MDSRKSRAEMLRSLAFCLLISLSIHPRSAISGWKIGSLPGFPGPLPFSMETGYIAVGESKEDHLFYYFIESERYPKEDPLLLWITGGPGCSAWSGLVFEIVQQFLLGYVAIPRQRRSPSLVSCNVTQLSWIRLHGSYVVMLLGSIPKAMAINCHLRLRSPVSDIRIDYNRAYIWITGPFYYLNEDYNGSVPALGRRQESWTKVASIIFLDSPVWTGFSYSSAAKAEQNGDIRSSKEVREFLLKWYSDHPHFLSNPLYIGGDSYSGITVPVIAQEIANANEAGSQPVLNLKGYLVGNPGTDYRFDGNYRVPYLHGMAIISDELYQAAKESCKGDYLNPSNPQCAEALDGVNKCMSGLNTVHILEPWCFLPSAKPKEYLMDGGQRRSLEEEHLNRFLKAPDQPSDCRSFGYMLSTYWANDQHVQKAIGVRQSWIKEWRRCNYGLSYMKDVASSITYHRDLTMKGYRALVYSGDHDVTIPYLASEAWIRTLNYSIVDDWRPWTVDSQVGGYTRTYANNLTFATVKGGGHTAPEYRPKECLAMVDRWISEKPL